MSIRRVITGGIFPLILSALLVVALFNTQNIQDWWVLRNYTPSEQIEQLAGITAMNDYGKKLFYLHDPTILNAQEFNENCTVAESSIVLGCYNRRDIYIFNVSDERLSGVQEVTAAHEMLHAAYDRLSTKEKQTVDSMTARQLQKVTNDRIIDVIKSYRARDAKSVANELHSILGTEVRDLDPELEDYYSRYFSDRAKVVGFSESYEQVFIENANKRDRLKASISVNRAQAETYEGNLRSDAESIQTLRLEMDRMLNQNRVSEYNNLVDVYNRRVDSYNSMLAKYKALLDETNMLIAEYNDLVTAQNDLILKLDSRANPL